jgi:transposase-like protein
LSARATGRKGGTRELNKRVRRLPPNALGQEQQHFLLTAGAVTMTEKQVARMSEAACYETYKALRFRDNGGEPFCPHKGCEHRVCYTLTTARQRRRAREGFVQPLYKCQACRRQFSVTSRRIFASRKRSFADILYSFIVFVNGVSGVAAVRLRRADGTSYKSAFVGEHKMREAIAASRTKRELGGERTVEIDGKVVGGHRRPQQYKAGQKTYGGPAQAVVVVRERGLGGESRMTVVNGHESNAQPFIRNQVVDGSHVVSDGGWDLSDVAGPGMHDRVIHKVGFSVNGIDNNQAESIFARLQRAEEGVHYRIAGANLDLYAQEVSWREDYRRVDNGTLWKMLICAVADCPQSRRWTGWWQRWQEEASVKRRRRRRWSGSSSV